MDSAIAVLGVLIGVSAGLFVVISLLVALPVRARAQHSGRPPSPDAAVWFGGPSRSEHGVSSSGLVLMERRPLWVTVPEADWSALAEAAEPGRPTGGASAGW
ncbi:hypothetical protein [Streptosporangium sp. KLBMP 9127]|nr:hypothetical protein [Streptosporangium sp. KLBMP 9127]